MPFSRNPETFGQTISEQEYQSELQYQLEFKRNKRSDFSVALNQIKDEIFSISPTGVDQFSKFAKLLEQLREIDIEIANIVSLIKL
jgi:hypothetical protein